MSFVDGLFSACFEPRATPSWATPTTPLMKHIAARLILSFLRKVRAIIVLLLQFLRFFEAKLDVQQRTVCVRPSMRVPC